MKKIPIAIILAYAVAAFSLTFGLLLIINRLDFRMPSSTRYTFGIVMILLAVYRISITQLKICQSRLRSNDEMH